MTPRLYVLPCRLVVSSCLDAFSKESAAKEPNTQRLFCGAVELPSTRTRHLKDPQTIVNGKIQACHAVTSMPPRQEQAIMPLRPKKSVKGMQPCQKQATHSEACRFVRSMPRPTPATLWIPTAKDVCESHRNGGQRHETSVGSANTLVGGAGTSVEARKNVDGGTQNIAGGIDTALIWLRQEAENRLSGV